MFTSWHLDPHTYFPSLHSPERHGDGNVTVNGDSQQAEDGALSEHQHEAGHEQTAVEVGAEAQADEDGKGDGQDAYSDVRNGQRHHKEVGDALEVAVEAHGPADQHIAQHGEAGNQQLHDDVAGLGGIVSRHDEAAGEVAGRESLFSTVIAAAPGQPTNLRSQRTLRRPTLLRTAGPTDSGWVTDPQSSSLCFSKTRVWWSCAGEAEEAVRALW